MLLRIEGPRGARKQGGGSQSWEEAWSPFTGTERQCYRVSGEEGVVTAAHGVHALNAPNTVRW